MKAVFYDRKLIGNAIKCWCRLSGRAMWYFFGIIYFMEISTTNKNRRNSKVTTRCNFRDNFKALKAVIGYYSKEPSGSFGRRIKVFSGIDTTKKSFSWRKLITGKKHDTSLRLRFFIAIWIFRNNFVRKNFKRTFPNLNFTFLAKYIL